MGTIEYTNKEAIGKKKSEGNDLSSALMKEVYFSKETIQAFIKYLRRKLLQQPFEIFYVLQIKRRIVSTETIQWNTVNEYETKVNALLSLDRLSS